VVVERIALAVKLANGEFLAPQRLEALYELNCAAVRQCVLLARAGDAAATAVVIPAAAGPAAAGPEAAPGAAMRRMVLAQMREAAVGARLRPWEVPVRVVLERGAWNEQVREGSRGPAGRGAGGPGGPGGSRPHHTISSPHTGPCRLPINSSAAGGLL
jgi:hypothetical protein